MRGRICVKEWRSPPKTKRSGTQPNESGLEIGRCCLFLADAYWNAERGRWTAAIRGTKGSHQTSEAPVSPSASRIASEQRLALAALGPAQPHIVPTRSGQPQ